jgi:hypothetical protein
MSSKRPASVLTVVPASSLTITSTTTNITPNIAPQTSSRPKRSTAAKKKELETDNKAVKAEKIDDSHSMSRSKSKSKSTQEKTRSERPAKKAKLEPSSESNSLVTPKGDFAGDSTRIRDDDLILLAPRANANTKADALAPPGPSSSQQNTSKLIHKNDDDLDARTNVGAPSKLESGFQCDDFITPLVPHWEAAPSHARSRDENTVSRTMSTGKVAILNQRLEEELVIRHSTVLQVAALDIASAVAKADDIM